MVMSLLKNFKIIISVLLIAVSFTGCMNSVHLKDLVIIEGMGIDLKEDKVNVTVQTLNANTFSSGESPQGNMTVNTDETGENIADAVSKLSKKLSKKLFFGQNKLIIFGKDAAEKDFKKMLDYFLRSAESRPDVAVCISNDKASDILESKENDNPIPTENMVYLLKNGQSAGVSAYITVAELMNMHANKTSDVYLPVVKTDEESKTVQANGLGLFKNDELVYITDDDETKGFLLLNNNVKNCMIEFKDDELGTIGVEISHVKAKKHIEIENGNVKLIVELKSQLVINEVEKGIITGLDKEKMKRVCASADKEISRLCTKAFYACRNNGSDCMRVGEYLAKDNPKSYEKLLDEWDAYYKKVDFNVKSKTDLKKISDNTQLD